MKYHAMLLFLVIFSLGLLSSCAHTARITGSHGQILNLEVSTIERVRLNGTDQWIYTAGVSAKNPILLWLDGGPGGTEVGTVRQYLGALHINFTIVCWDQRGTGRSRRAVRDWKSVRVDDWVEDTIALSKILYSRNGGKPIYLVGHSWGSIIGVMAAQRAPELYAAYIGVGQQVNAIENDRIGWEMVRNGALAAGESNVAETLDQNGPPPYQDGDQYLYLFRRLYRYSPHPPAPSNFDSSWYFRASEHRLLDKINAVRGLMDGVKYVYPQLTDLDFEQTALNFECPIFIVNGRYDMTCVADITYRWYQKIEAPYKDLVWFENSGHNPCYQEPQDFVEYLTTIVVPKSQAVHSTL